MRGEVRLEGRANNRLWDALEQSQVEGFAQVGTLGRKRARRQADRNERTLVEASRELKVPPKALSKFIRKLGLLPDAKWNGDAISIDQATFQTLRGVVDDLITLPQTKEITGIPGHEFRPVAKAGFIQEFTGLPINGVAGPKYKASDVKSVVATLRSINNVAAESEMRTLLGHARAKNMLVGDLLIACLCGVEKPAGSMLTKTGLRALYFSQS